MKNNIITIQDTMYQILGKMDVNISAMNEDSDIQMITENYKYMMWSILAIIIIFGTMKTLKNK